METFLIIYSIFSYCFVLGVQISNVENGADANWWNFILSPILLPVLLGKGFTDLCINIRNINNKE